jgi:hypothetical protein
MLAAAAASLTLSAETDSGVAAPAPGSKEEKKEQKRILKAVKSFKKQPSAAEPEDVCAWLGSIGLGHCAVAFREQHVRPHHTAVCIWRVCGAPHSPTGVSRLTAPCCWS